MLQDTETGLYYLQSRYYEPALGRFIIADTVYDTGAGLQGYNLFLYCGNNPTNRIDASGNSSIELTDADITDDQVSERESGRNNVAQSGTYSSGQGLKSCANTANASVSGKGPVAGTKKHTAFAMEVNKLGNPYFRTEVSYSNGSEVYHGYRGSIRFDVLQVDSKGNPVAAWDLKTGTAILTESRIAQMQARSGLYIPIHMVK